jgi:type I restriction enzyme S subunit
MAVKAGYKQTEVGVIPEEWDISPCSAVSERIMVGIVIRPSQYYVKNGVPAFRSANIREEGINDLDLVFISEASNLVLSKSQTRTGDVLTVRTGYPGTSAVVHSKHAGCNCIDILITRPSDKVDSEWLAIWINSPFGKEQVLRNQGGLAQKHFNVGDLRNLVVALPQLPEQRAIAAVLSDVDALLGGLARLIAKKRDLKQAVMQQLLTGQTRLPGFGGAWEVNTVAELEKKKLVKLSRGQVISQKDIDHTPGDFPIYSSSIHNDGLFGRYGEFMFDEELITWSVDGGGNFFHRPRHKFSVTNVCGFMRVETSRIDYRFFAAELQLLHSQKNFDYQSKAHPSVIRKEYEVLLPTLAEQTAIAAVLSDMDAELAALEARREKTRALKQGMMQELLTGRTRLI